MSVFDHLIYALMWLLFGVVHSLLAGPKLKQLLHKLLGSGYRFSYNVFALVHIAIVIYGTRYFLANSLPLLPLSATVFIILNGMMVAGIILFIAALFQYDLGLFSGLKQLRENNGAEDDEPLHLAGFHRYVRHPLYSAAHLYLWGSIKSEFDLITAVWASTYLIIGSYFEERKLIRTYGKAYSDYIKKVPAVFPWRGKAI